MVYRNGPTLTRWFTCRPGSHSLISLLLVAVYFGAEADHRSVRRIA